MSDQVSLQTYLAMRGSLSHSAVDKFTKLASWLEANGRKALISEVGGGNTASCQTKWVKPSSESGSSCSLGVLLKYVSTNDAFIGFAAWSVSTRAFCPSQPKLTAKVGSFDASYELSITPVGGQENELFVKAVRPYLPG
jgi:endoglucanase